MSDWVVASLSAKQIHTAADNLRYILGVSNSYVPNLCGIIEHELRKLVPDFLFAIEDQIQLANGEYAEAQTGFDPPSITFQREMYLRLSQWDARARFTAAHEIGHLFLHEGAGKLNRLPSRSDAKFDSRSAEWQANQFAAAFLAPEHLLRGFGSADEAAQLLGVSKKVIEIRGAQLKLWAKDKDISAWLKLREEMGIK